MRTLLTIWALSSLSGAADLELDVWGNFGSHGAVDGAVDGAVITDHLGGANYLGFVGQLVLMPVDPAFLAEVPPDAPGLIVGDSNGEYAGLRGIAGFCIDSETPFLDSVTETSRYVALGYDAANNRYINEGVTLYTEGGLLRAAFLLERFYDEAHAGGDIEAAALQAAIWEVLYDESPSVVTGSGNYYVRNNTGNTTHNSRSEEVIQITAQWFAAAIAEGWGGMDYNPTGRVIFWLDPDATHFNQSILTLDPRAALSVPEPGIPVLATGFLLLLCRRRRHDRMK